MKFKSSYFLLPLALMALKNSASAQSVVIPIETANNALVLQANDKHDVNTVYFGPKLANNKEYDRIAAVFGKDNDYTGQMASVYTPAGSRNLLEPAIAITHADGNQSLDLKYVSHKVDKVSDDVSLLTIVLKDNVYNTEVTLYYKSYFKDDVIEQWSTIRNGEKGTIVLNKFASADLYLKRTLSGLPNITATGPEKCALKHRKLPTVLKRWTASWAPVPICSNRLFLWCRWINRPPRMKEP